MRHLVIALILLVTASAAFAGPIMDVQTGVYTEGDLVVVSGAVVTGARSNGFFMSEDPNAPYAGVWVYTGSGNHTAVEGDLVDVAGTYAEYFDLTEIDVAAAAELGYATVVGQFSGQLMPLYVTVAELAADAEPYESCLIHVTDGMMVSAESNNFGEWAAESMDAPGNFLAFDDYWYDPSALLVGDCFNGAIGCLNYSFSEFKLEVLVDGLTVVECTVDTDPVSFDSVKSLYR